MGGLVVAIIVGLLLVIPFWRLLPKFGLPSWVALVAFIPLLALILLWVIAFRDKIGGGQA